MPESFLPATKSYTARFDPNRQDIVVAYFGIQTETPLSSDFEDTKASLTNFLSDASGPQAIDEGLYRDDAGYTNIIIVAYWETHADFTMWTDTSGFSSWWQDDRRVEQSVGLFREVYHIKMDRLETIFSDQNADGCALIGDHMSGEIREHAYWGSSRDRLPISQIDFLEPAGYPSAELGHGTHGRRVQVKPHDNLCMVRFGQDLSDADTGERTLYAEKIEPELKVGMAYLSEKGERIGCLSNRFMELTDDGTEDGSLYKSYSISMWQSLAHLERWAESHPTHLSIYLAAMNYFRTLRGQHKLRIYHEMCVLPASAQLFEYVNCHPQTGMMRNARST